MDQVIIALNSLADLFNIPVVSGIVGVISGIVIPIFGAIGIVKYTKNNVLGAWSYRAGVNVNKWCVQKIGKRHWEPIENHFRPALKVMAEQFIQGMKDTV